MNRECKQVAREQRLVMNRHHLDSYVFEHKTWKEVIYVAGAHKYSEQMNRHRGEPRYIEQLNCM